MKLHIQSRIILYFILLVVAASGFAFVVFLPHPFGFYASIAVAAFAGFCISLNIFDTKRKGKQLVCPTGSDCNAVVTSRYSKFFGISLEYWGMAYFAVMTIAYTALIFAYDAFTMPVIVAIIIASIAAGFFSIYLLFVQAFLLKKWCIWCILTAFLSLSIFVFSLSSAEGVTTFLQGSVPILALFTYLGFSFGVGGITVAVLLFAHFLQDADIDEREASIINSIFELVWLGFGLVLVSRFSLFVAFPDLLEQAPFILAQIVSLFVFALSGAILMIIYAPFLVYLPFTRVKEGEVGASFRTLRRPTLVLGSVAFVSWYFAFAVNFFQQAPLSLLGLVFVVLLLVIGFVVALVDRRMSRSPSQHTQ